MIKKLKWAIILPKEFIGYNQEQQSNENISPCFLLNTCVVVLKTGSLCFGLDSGSVSFTFLFYHIMKAFIKFIRYGSA